MQMRIVLLAISLRFSFYFFKRRVMSIIKSIFIGALSAVTFYTLIQWATPTEKIIVEPITVETIWGDYISDSEKAIMCNAYWTQPYEEVIFEVQTAVDFEIGGDLSIALYDVLNRECV